MIPDAHFDLPETVRGQVIGGVIGKNVVIPVGVESAAEQIVEIVGIAVHPASGFLRHHMKPVQLLLFELTYVYFQYPLTWGET